MQIDARAGMPRTQRQKPARLSPKEQVEQPAEQENDYPELVENFFCLHTFSQDSRFFLARAAREGQTVSNAYKSIRIKIGLLTSDYFYVIL